MSKLNKALLSAAVTFMTIAPTVHACPMCKDSVSNDEGTTSGPMDAMSAPSSGVPGGFNTSVYLMLAAFFGTLGLMGYTIVQGARQTPVEPRKR